MQEGGVRGGGSHSHVCAASVSSMIDESEKRGGGDSEEQILKPNLCFAEMCESRLASRREWARPAQQQRHRRRWTSSRTVLLCQAEAYYYCTEISLSRVVPPPLGAFWSLLVSLSTAKKKFVPCK